ncbi:histone deacetylase family protein [Haloferula sp. A504]|uniref:histone deacetylase family protein n=1 Tax=Haloferula sp. A504 TaxID=3373601 RepID=UPI0037BEC76E
MRPIFDPVCLQHDTGTHPECAARLAGAGFEEETVPSGEEFLTLVHDPEHVERVREACARGVPLDPDTVTSPRSYEAALRAVGATLRAAGEGGFAITRPPGHHASASRVSGFCLFNNIAIAARKLANEGKRVLIFDFDGHMGDGTAAIFDDDDQVLYWSIHQYPAFPGTGSEEQTGSGKGVGHTVNVPLPPGSGDDLFMEGIRHTLPVARAFKPDVVAVSAGFDAHRLDPLLDLNVTEHSFHQVGRLLADEFSEVFATLEGGYEPRSLRSSVGAFLDGVNGRPFESGGKSTVSDFKHHDEFGMRLCHLEECLAPVWKL